MECIQSLAGEAFNFSSSDTYSVLQLIELAEKSLGVTIPYKVLNTAKNEIPYQHLDDANVRARGWKNQSTINSALKETYHWYKQTIPLLF